MKARNLLSTKETRSSGHSSVFRAGHSTGNAKRLQLLVKNLLRIVPPTLTLGPIRPISDVEFA